MKRWYEDYDTFFTVFNRSGVFADETVFFFRNGRAEEEHYMAVFRNLKSPIGQVTAMKMTDARL